MTTMTRHFDSAAVMRRKSRLRQMLAGAASFDLAGGVFCLAAATDLARWLSIPQGAAYVTGALFLAAAGAGGLTLRREPPRVAWIASANELFAAWCLVVLASDTPNATGAALLVIASISSAGTGVAELLMRRRRGQRDAG